MHFISVLTILYFILQSVILQCYASHNIDISKHQSEFVDTLWSGRLHEPYQTMQVSQFANSHALCRPSTGPSSVVLSHGPSGATYGFAFVNTTSNGAAAFGEEVPSLTARYERPKKAKKKMKLNVVVTDEETAKRVNRKSPMLFYEADFGQTCL